MGKDIYITKTVSYANRGAYSDGIPRLTKDIQSIDVNNIVDDNYDPDIRIIRVGSSINTGAQGNDAHFEFIQTIGATTWIVNHGLNKIPAVTLTDEFQNEVFAHIKHDDLNTTRIEFSQPFSGKALFN